VPVTFKWRVPSLNKKESSLGLKIEPFAFLNAIESEAEIQLLVSKGFSLNYMISLKYELPKVMKYKDSNKQKVKVSPDYGYCLFTDFNFVLNMDEPEDFFFYRLRVQL